MNIYYVYAYLRKDGTPYYIGKGTENRAWIPHRYKTKSSNYLKGVNIPPDNRIIILESNLTSIGAFALERRMIRWYGRKDNNTGILQNRTDGGEGLDGVIRTEEWKNNISKSHLGKVKSKSHKENLSKALKGNVPWNKGLYEKREYRSNNILHTFKHKDGTIEKCTMYQLREKYNLDQPNISAIVSGRRKIHKGWTIETFQGAFSHKL